MKKAIGIIGGMGPSASVYMYKTLIDLAISEFNAVNNEDFPEIILYSVPVPDFISSDGKKSQALSMLKKTAKDLNKMNILCLSVTCNTAHILIDQLQRVSNTPFISMIEAVVNAVLKNRLDKIGLLATPSTLHSNMYQSAFSKHGIKVLAPADKEFLRLENIIRNVIKGSSNKADQKELIRLATILKKDGAEGIVLGCTELPLVFPDKYSIPIYNSVEILSRELLKKYYNNVNIHS